ncbi:MAG: hypothetical protein KY391_05850 [Actinobacteria bacterium]|nr:hypothetical protein [Actinomycetota bacterium]
MVVALGGTNGARARPEADDRAAIQAVLDARAAAIAERDRAAFLRTLAPDSRAFVARQTALFERLATVPLASYRLVAVWDRYGDLARGSDRARYDAADAVSIPLTEERYRIRGVDRDEAVEDIYFTFVRRDGEWLIAEDTDLDDLTLYSGRHLWDFGPVERDRSRDLLQFSHPCTEGRSCAATAHDYLALADRALQRVEAYWTAPWDRDMILLIPDDQAELRRLIQATFPLEDFVAFAYSSVDVSDSIRYTGHRIILNPEAFADRSDETVILVLAHEMLHVASRYSAGPFVPFFVDEGIADYVGSAADPSALRFFANDVAAGRFDGRLPEDYQFTVGTGAEIYRSYQKSQSAVRFFIDRWGLPAFIRFYRSLGSKKVVAGTAEYHLSRSLKKATGLDLEAFEKAWADSIS